MRKAAEHAATLDAVEKRYGVDRYVILAIWGVETSYGALARSLGRDPLALDARAGALAPSVFSRRADHRAAILQQRPRRPRGACWDRGPAPWASRSSCRRASCDYAVDFSGDGRRDIWTNVPDVLASIANYLRKKGWTPGLSWGFEVVAADRTSTIAAAAAPSTTGGARPAARRRRRMPRRRATRSCSSRAARTVRPSWSPTISSSSSATTIPTSMRWRSRISPTGCAGEDRSRRQMAGQTTGSCRWRSASRCRRSSRNSAIRCAISPATSTSICATRSGSAVKIGMTPDGHPTLRCWIVSGSDDGTAAVRLQCIPSERRLRFSASSSPCRGDSRACRGRASRHQARSRKAGRVIRATARPSGSFVNGRCAISAMNCYTSINQYCSVSCDTEAWVFFTISCHPRMRSGRRGADLTRGADLPMLACDRLAANSTLRGADRPLNPMELHEYRRCRIARQRPRRSTSILAPATRFWPRSAMSATFRPRTARSIRRPISA